MSYQNQSYIEPVSIILYETGGNCSSYHIEIIILNKINVFTFI